MRLTLIIFIPLMLVSKKIRLDLLVSVVALLHAAILERVVVVKEHEQEVPEYATLVHLGLQVEVYAERTHALRHDHAQACQRLPTKKMGQALHDVQKTTSIHIKKVSVSNFRPLNLSSALQRIISAIESYPTGTNFMILLLPLTPLFS